MPLGTRTYKRTATRASDLGAPTVLPRKFASPSTEALDRLRRLDTDGGQDQRHAHRIIRKQRVIRARSGLVKNWTRQTSTKPRGRAECAKRRISAQCGPMF